MNNTITYSAKQIYPNNHFFSSSSKEKPNYICDECGASLNDDSMTFKSRVLCASCVSADGDFQANFARSFEDRQKYLAAKEAQL